MRKLYTLLTAIIITTSAFAQAPEMMSYQAVIRDGSNALVASSSVGMQISILQGSSSGTAVYVETQTPTSNANGLVSVEIGGGIVVSGTFASIDWANGPYYIQTETDPTGGTSYTITGTSQLLSVPYALHAKNTDSWTVNADTTYTNKWVGIVSSSPQAPLYVGGGPNGDASVKLKNGFGTSKVLHIIEEQGSSGHYGLFVGASDYSDAVFVTKGGRVGVRTLDPQRQLHINDVMRLEPRATAPSSPAKGDIYMDDITNKLRVYDGTQWQDCW